MPLSGSVEAGDVLGVQDSLLHSASTAGVQRLNAIVFTQ